MVASLQLAALFVLFTTYYQSMKDMQVIYQLDDSSVAFLSNLCFGSVAGRSLPAELRYRISGANKDPK